jgi:hypothetical protein
LAISLLRREVRNMLASLVDQTSFAFCFHPKEGVLLLGGLQLLTGLFWIYMLINAPTDAWESPSPVRILTIGLLFVNAVLCAGAVRLRSERCAFAAVGTFGLQLASLAAEAAGSSPAGCSNEDTVDTKPLGAWPWGGRVVWWSGRWGGGCGGGGGGGGARLLLARACVCTVPGGALAATPPPV